MIHGGLCGQPSTRYPFYKQLCEHSAPSLTRSVFLAAISRNERVWYGNLAKSPLWCTKEVKLCGTGGTHKSSNSVSWNQVAVQFQKYLYLIFFCNTNHMLCTFTGLVWCTIAFSTLFTRPAYGDCKAVVGVAINLPRYTFKTSPATHRRLCTNVMNWWHVHNLVGQMAIFSKTSLTGARLTIISVLSLPRIKCERTRLLHSSWPRQ